MDDCYVWFPIKLSWTKEADFLSSGENFIISIMIISVAEYDEKCVEKEKPIRVAVTQLQLHRGPGRPGCEAKSDL